VRVLRVGLEEGGDRKTMWSRLCPGTFRVIAVLGVLVGRGEDTRAKHLEVLKGVLEISGIKNVVV
jgi:hypothetical protein